MRRVLVLPSCSSCCSASPRARPTTPRARSTSPRPTTSVEVARTDLDAGTSTFAVKNDGDDVTEVYVYADGDEVKGEVENIGPGTSRDLDVDLTAGEYEVACKPGMKGDGIRTPDHRHAVPAAPRRRSRRGR